MNKAITIFQAVATCCVMAQADWLLNPYETVAADSAEVNAIYGIQAFANPASDVSITVPAAGVIQLVGTKIASDGTEGYTANIGLLHPLTPDWAIADVTGVTAITLDVKFSAKPADGFEIALASDEYPKVYADGGKTYTKKVLAGGLPAAGVWKTLTLPIEEFLPPDWWCVPDDVLKPCPADFPTLATILKNLKAVQFAPKVKYSAAGTQNGTGCTGCVTPTQPAITTEIRNVTLVGIGDGPGWIPNYSGCNEPKSFTLDRFFDGDNVNENGGYWFNISDFDSTGTSVDSAKGSSTSAVEFIPGDETADESGLARLTAGLNKTIPTSTMPYHKYAGWAALGVGFEKDGIADVTGLTAFSFQIKGQKLGPQIKGVTFKAVTTDVTDDAPHQVLIPAQQVNDEAVAMVCVRPIDLKQASWVTGAKKVDFNPAKLKQLIWEVKINDQKSAAITKDTAAFTVTDVRFWGIDSLPVTHGTGVKGKVVKNTFGASYKSGILSLQGLAGFKSVEVVSILGKTVASVSPVAKAAVKLDRGTYVLVAKGEGKALTRKLVVTE